MTFRAATTFSTSQSWSRIAAFCGMLLGLAACSGSASNSGNALVPSTTSGTAAVTGPGGSASSSSQAAGIATPLAGTTAAPGAIVTTMPNSAVGAGGNSTPVRQAVTVHATYMLPASLTTSSSATHTLAAQSITHRQLQYVSPSNTSVSIAVTPTGGATSTYGPSGCTAVSCAISFTALPGPTTLTFTLTNGSVQTLSSFSTLAIVQPNTVNTLSFTANPVVSSVTLQLASTSINAGTPANVALTVNALDASGNTIVGNGNYVDVNGNPVSIMLSSVNSQNGGHGTAVIQGPLRVTAPGQAVIKLHYDGNWLDHTTVTATSTSSAVNMGGATTTLTTVPHATEYAVTGGPIAIVAGPDGNLWFTEINGNAIGKMTPSGSYTVYSCAPCSYPGDITVGPDGNLWFGEYPGQYIDKITTTGVTSRVLPINGWGSHIRSGPDGNIWYSTDGNGTGKVIGKLSVKGTSLATYTVGVGIRGFGFAPDGSLWYATQYNTTIGHISLAGASFGSVTVSNLGNFSDGVVAGPDGNMWIANYGSGQLDKVTPAGSVTQIALQSSAEPNDIVVGPDGKLWFTEQGTNTIGVIAPGSTTPTEFTSAVNGISSSSVPFGMTVGPDGNIWFVEYAANKIAKFVW